MADLSNNGPLVSVAMITYNHERFVTTAIESVLAQRTDFPIELVIGDDASSDDTRRRIAPLKAQAPEVIRTLFHASNVGAHRNFEMVLEQCRGEFVAFLEGDDYWICEEKLQMQANVLRARSDLVGVFHPTMIVDSFGRDTGKKYPPDCREEIGTRELLQYNPMPAVSVMMRRNVIPKLPVSYQKLKMTDWPIWILASLHGRWLCLPKVMSAYRVHGAGAWSSLSAAEAHKANAELMRELALQLPQPLSRMARQRAALFQLLAWKTALDSGQPVDLLRELLGAAGHFRYYQTGDGRRFASALWQTLSPRTHLAAKRALQMIRQTRAYQK